MGLPSDEGLSIAIHLKDEEEVLPEIKGCQQSKLLLLNDLTGVKLKLFSTIIKFSFFSFAAKYLSLVYRRRSTV